MEFSRVESGGANGGGGASAWGLAICSLSHVLIQEVGGPDDGIKTTRVMDGVSLLLPSSLTTVWENRLHAHPTMNNNGALSSNVQEDASRLDLPFDLPKGFPCRQTIREQALLSAQSSGSWTFNITYRSFRCELASLFAHKSLHIRPML